MSSLYHNPKLGERVRDVAVIDRFTRTVQGTLEAVVSLSIQTDGQSGVVMAVMSLDAVLDRQTVASTVLAVYPMAQQAHCEQDGRIVAAKYGLDLRRATPGIGWECAALATEDTRDISADFMIGG